MQHPVQESDGGFGGGQRHHLLLPSQLSGQPQRGVVVQVAGACQVERVVEQLGAGDGGEGGEGADDGVPRGVVIVDPVVASLLWNAEDGLPFRYFC